MIVTDISSYRLDTRFWLLPPTHPPVLDQLTLLWLLPLGQLILPPLTLPPVQKYFCPSLATSPRNSRSLLLLSREIGLIPLSLQNLAPPPWVKEVQPSFQDTR